MDNLPVQLQSKVFQYISELPDFQNCRIVSKKWKRAVLDACRNKFHVVYPLTDSTLYTAHELTDALVSLDIYSFTGKENKNAWSTSGIEALLQTTEWLQFTGTKVYVPEIQKMIGLARNSLKTLSFKCLNVDITRPLLKITEPFSALRKLHIGYYCSKSDNDNFNTFTDSLEKWNDQDCKVQLPVLECLHLNFDGRSGMVNYNSYYVYTKDLFRNYVAIIKLLLKYKLTLKEIQIERVFAAFVIPETVEPEWTKRQRGFEALEELSLNKLKLSTKTMYHGGEIEVKGRPRNLKQIFFRNLICSNDTWFVLITTLSSFNNVDARYLTSVKIKAILNYVVDPTLVINFGVLKDCRNLKTLWLSINSSVTNPQKILVKDLELLSTTISDLRFEPLDHHRYSMCTHEILLSQQQIRWIVDNLRALESFSMSLVIPEQIHVNANNEQLEVVDEDIDVVDNVQEAEWQEDANRLTNINVETFRQLIAMPNMKNVRVDIMRAKALAAIRTENMNLRLRRGQRQLGTTLDVVREYSDLSDAAGYHTTASQNFLGAFMYGYATLKMVKNQN